MAENIYWPLKTSKFVWLRSEARTAEGEVLGNERINKSSHVLCFLQGGNIATKKGLRRLQP